MPRWMSHIVVFSGELLLWEVARLFQNNDDLYASTIAGPGMGYGKGMGFQAKTRAWSYVQLTFSQMVEI